MATSPQAVSKHDASYPRTGFHPACFILCISCGLKLLAVKETASTEKFQQALSPVLDSKNTAGMWLNH